MTKIAVLVGSLRKESYNRQLAKAIEKLAPEGFEFEHFDIGSLPLYNQDFDADYPAVCKQLKALLESADGLLFVTPEYNRSTPGVLKNALDIGSRPWGTNSFAGKRGGIVGISVGAIGTAVAQHDLRGILSYLDVRTLHQPEVYLHYQEGFFDADGGIANADSRKFLQGWVDKYVAWLKD